MGITFDHYHHSNGADLYIAQGPAVTTVSGSAPLISLDGTPGAHDFSTSYTTGNASGILISAANAIIDDPDTVAPDSLISQLDVSISDPHSGAAEFLKINAAGHTFLSSHPELTVTGENTQTLHIAGTASETVYQTLLRDILYVNTDTSASLNTSARHIAVQATDAAVPGHAATRTTTISLANGNVAPTVGGASTLAGTVTEDGTLTATGNVIGQDGNADTLTYTGDNGSALGSFNIVEATGAWSYTLNNASAAVQGLKGSDVVTENYNVAVSDGNGGIANTTVAITIHGNNDGPVAVHDNFSTNEDVALVANVLTNDTDVDTGDSKSVVNFTVGGTTQAAGTTIHLASGADLSVSSTGNVTLTQNGAYNSQHAGDAANIVFSYTMEDVVHAQSSTDALITVNGVNDAPAAVDDAAPQAVLENTSLVVDAAHGVLANDTDPDGPSPLTAVAGTFATAHGGQLVLAANGSYTYTPAASYFGTDTVNYTITDGLLTDIGTLTIEVTEQGFRSLDAASVDGSGNIFVGTGNTGTNYNVSENHAAGLELGLKIHYRTGDDITPLSREADGTSHYLVPAGSQVVDPAHDVVGAAANRAAWNFDFSVDTDTTGSSGKTLNSYNFTITISDGEGHTQVYDLVHNVGGNAANTPWQLRGGPVNTGFGDEETAQPIRRCRRIRSISHLRSCNRRLATISPASTSTFS